MQIKCSIYLILNFFFLLPTFSQNILIDDFERGYNKWRFEGDQDAFGLYPAKGNAKGQPAIKGYGGTYLVNSFYYSGNDPVGKMILKKPFIINRKYLLASVGGGYDFDNVYLRVVNSEGKELGRLTGRHSEEMHVQCIDLSSFQKQKAYVEIVDNWNNPWWGHINVDDIYLSDSLKTEVITSQIEIGIKSRYLVLPVKNKSTHNRLIEIRRKNDSTLNSLFYAEVLPLSFSDPDWKAVLPVESLKGKRITLRVEHRRTEVPDIEQSDTIPYRMDVSDEIFRPQYFYTARQGYLNDPNGLVYWKGRWHLFYQYTPTAIDARKKSWGHAVSDDLITWQELPPAINVFYENGKEHNIFSGTGYVDRGNRSGLFSSPEGGVLFAFTCTGKGEYIAYADDEYLMDIKIMKSNPVITQNGRDPRIFFNDKSGSWGILRYEEFENDSLSVREKSKLENVRKAFSFYKSKNLKEWAYASSIEDRYECPDMFSINTASGDKYIVLDASGKYLIGTFDGNRFLADSEAKPRIIQGDFYAMQHFQNAPDGRVVVVGWIGQDIDKMKEHNMCFSQVISIPMELTLQKDELDNFYLTALPVREMNSYGKELVQQKTFSSIGQEYILIPNVPTSAIVDLELIWNKADRASISIGDMRIVFDKQNNELSIAKDKHTAPRVFKVERPDHDKLKLQIFIDRSVLGVFYDRGQSVVFQSCFLGKDLIPVTVSSANAGEGSLSIRSIKTNKKTGKPVL